VVEFHALVKRRGNAFVYLYCPWRKPTSKEPYALCVCRLRESKIAAVVPDHRNS
jgi:hypothetical protein